MGLNGNQNQVYDVLPVALKNNGFTHTAAFSLYLNNATATTGNLLFGAYDTTKFTGSLFTMPWDLAVTGLVIDDTTTGSTVVTPVSAASVAFPYQASIDTGVSLIELPPDAYDIVAQHFGICDGNRVIPCDLGGLTGNLVWTMGGGVDITMPFSQTVTALYNDDGSVLTGDRNGEQVPICNFQIYKGSFNSGLFMGDPFLRMAYTIYDSDRQQVAMAQAAFNVPPTSSNIVEIPNNSGNLAGQASVTAVAFSTADGSSYSQVCSG